MNNEELEKLIQEAQATAPRVTLGMIDDTLSKSLISYTVLPNTTTTICHVTLLNGFVLIGTSACISKENFNARIGCRIAFDKAKDQLWGLMGYAMMDDMYNERLREDALTPV